eukprot:scaffold2505_cov157-Skeletonema_menzelii.AAC.2
MKNIKHIFLANANLFFFRFATLANTSNAQLHQQPLLRNNPHHHHPPCNICGNFGEITNPDAVLHIPPNFQQHDDNNNNDEMTCAEFDTNGRNGHISSTLCNLLSLETVHVCDCQEVQDEEDEVEMMRSQPSPSLPSTCPFCTTGITIRQQHDPNSNHDDNDKGINDDFEYTLCQRFMVGAQFISAHSVYCQKLLVGERFCCPSNDIVNGEMSMDYSFLYLYQYHTAKAAKAKARKGRRGRNSKSGKKKLVRDYF